MGWRSSPDAEVAQRLEQQLRDLGFRTRLRLYSAETVFTRFCGVRKADVHVCPNGGWVADFADPQGLLDPPFSGDTLDAASGPNTSELNDPTLDAMIARARLMTDPGERASAWAAVNRKVVSLAPTVPYLWDVVPAVASADVRGVQNPMTGGWDLSFTSLRSP